MSHNGFGRPSGSAASSRSQPNPIRAPSSSPSGPSYSSQPPPSRTPEPIFASQNPTPIRASAANKPRCFECGTHRMRVRRGQLICKYGHVQQHFRIEHAFDDEYEESQRVTARRKMTRKKSKRTFTSRRTGAVSELEQDADDDDLTELEEAGHGSRRDRRGRPTVFRAGTGTEAKMQGRFKRLQCLQLILRMQLEQLAHHFRGKLPSEAELIARELWTMLVASLPVSEFPPEPLVAATFDYRSTRDIDEDRQEVETDRGIEPIYDIEQDLELEARLAEREKQSRAEARRRRRLHNGNSNAHDSANQSGADVQTSGTEGWTDEERIDRDLADPEEMLASLDPVFAKEHREKRRRENTSATSEDGGGDAARSDVDELRSDSDQADDDDVIDDPYGAPHPPSGRPASCGRPPRRRRLVPIYRSQRWPETTDGESEWSEGYRSTGASSTGTSRAGGGSSGRQSQRVFSRGGSSNDEMRRLMRFASLPSTLAILYLTLSKLQIPILWSDLTALAASYKLTFLEAVQRLPASLVLALNADDIRYGKLDVSSIPTISSLNTHTAQLAQLLHVNFGIGFDEPSGAVMLWRLVDGMGLPPTIYCAAKRMLSFLGVRLHINVAAASESVGEVGGADDAMAAMESDGVGVMAGRPTKRGRPKKRVLMLEDRFPVPREFMMMASILVIVKMRYGMDWEERDETLVYPPSLHHDDEPQHDAAAAASATPGFVSGLPTLQRWVSALMESNREKSHHLSSVHEVFRSVEPLDMSTEQIDGYLSFLEENLIQPNHPALYGWRRPTELDDLLSFTKCMPPALPPSSAPPARRPPTLESVHHRIFSTLYAQPCPPSTVGVEAGDRYNIYQLTTDPAGTLPVEMHTTYMKILETANRIVGIQPPNYVPARWKRRQREAALKGLEREMGIQAHVEKVEGMLVKMLKERKKELVRCRESGVERGKRRKKA